MIKLEVCRHINVLSLNKINYINQRNANEFLSQSEPEFTVTKEILKAYPSVQDIQK